SNCPTEDRVSPQRPDASAEQSTGECGNCLFALINGFARPWDAWEQRATDGNKRHREHHVAHRESVCRKLDVALRCRSKDLSKPPAPKNVLQSNHNKDCQRKQ